MVQNFTCIGVSSQPVVAEREITWLLDSVDTLVQVSPTITTTSGMNCTSELQTTVPSTTGTYNYTCHVRLVVEGDPVVEGMDTAVLIVTGEREAVCKREDCVCIQTF